LLAYASAERALMSIAKHATELAQPVDALSVAGSMARAHASRRCGAAESDG
jgi:hypothetical protein